MAKKITAAEVAMDLLDGVETQDDFFALFQWPWDDKHVKRSLEILEWKREVEEQQQQDHVHE